MWSDKTFSHNIGLMTILAFLFFCSKGMLVTPADASTPPQTRMRDSQTGYAVFPDEIIIIDTKTNKTVYHKTYTREESMKEFKGGAFPTMPDLPPGYYKYIIQAKGYKPISSSFFIAGKTPQQSQQESSQLQLNSITFNLDPIEAPPELKNEVLLLLKRDDSHVLVGFTVDDDTGLPLANAVVTVIGRGATAKSNKQGFFMIRIPLKEPCAVEATNIIFEKDGYRSEEIDHMQIEPRGVAHTPIWLKPGRGKRIVDENTKIERVEP
jgi:hypothetical protein